MGDTPENTGSLVIEQNADGKSTSNLQAIFRENCELTNVLTVMADSDNIMDCTAESLPANTTEAGLRQENEVLKSAVESLGNINPAKLY